MMVLIYVLFVFFFLISYKFEVKYQNKIITFMKSLFQFNVGKINREQRLKSETKLESQADLLL